jgi:protein required for attachment to host cells
MAQAKTRENTEMEKSWSLESLPRDKKRKPTKKQPFRKPLRRDGQKTPLAESLDAHWFVVASQREARIFVQTLDRRSHQKRLKMIKKLVNPLGEVKRRDLIRKQAGRGIKSIGRVGSVQYSQTKRHDPQDEATLQFAHSLVRYLQKEYQKNHFFTLTIFAEPRLLGKMRSKMNLSLGSTVLEWRPKDLQKAPAVKLTGILTSSPVKGGKIV